VETSLTTNQLIVNDDLYFDTIVIRRPTNIGTGQFTGIREVQLFVNDVNVLPDLVTQSTFNVDGTPLQDISEIPFFIDWSDKTLDINHATFYASNVVNDIIDSTTSFVDGAYWGIQNGAQISNINVALYIPMSDKINIKDIQSAIIYNRKTDTETNVTFVGCAIELYNRSIDPNLENTLSSTNVITTPKNVYRFDYPAIDTYPSGDFSDTDSIDYIASETLALKDVVSEFAESANITGGLKADTITTTGNVDISGNVSVSGSLSNPNQPCFKVIRTNTSESSVAGENLKFNEAVIDNRNGYDSTDFEYTIPVDGNWYFYYSFASNNEELKIQLQQNTIVRDEITTGTITFPVK